MSLAIPMVGVNSFKTAHHLVDKVISIDETYIYRAVIRLLEFEKSVVECSGATSLAVIMANMLPELFGKKVVCILSGGNIDITTLNRVIEKGLAFDGRLCRFVVTLADKPDGIAELCDILKDIGANVKDISHDRIWSTSSVLQVQVKCVCEIRNASHGTELKHTLKAKYKHVVWDENAF
ncbi:L-threonine dehydratase biosynthetic IlvA [Schistosoma japonicum]|nr:L-threonine dehydratase biosynthetic IlvA [Schistosoma japonicum]